MSPAYQEFDKVTPVIAHVIICHVIDRFRDRYPDIMSVIVDPYMKDIALQQSLRKCNFSLLTGETQAGKTIAMHLLSWILIYQKGYIPCFVTKKISCLRDDALDKLTYGDVNTIVREVCAIHGCSDVAKHLLIKGCVGIKSSDVERGTVPIYLMQPENNLKVLQWIKMLSKRAGLPAYPVLFFDEAHELFTTAATGYLQRRGLTMDCLEKNKISNHALIHKIAEVCKQYRCAMIGITATPQRALSSDPEVCPDHIYRLPCRAPKAGLMRIGYDDSGRNEFKNATFHELDTVVDVVQEVLDRDVVTLTTGERQIKFLNITTDHFNADMEDTSDVITDAFDDDQVYVKLFVQSKSSSSNNIQCLDEFFDLRNIPDTVIQNGVIILIGKSREAAGITIKPSFKMTQDGHHQVTIDEDVYIVNGITDMCISLPNNMEAAEQLLGRASGWFDANHEMHIWLPSNHMEDAKYGIIKTKNAMIDIYDGAEGPSSVIEISNYCTSITKITTNNNYKCDQRSHIGISRSEHLPLIGYQLETVTVDLPKSIVESYLLAQNMPGGGRSAAGRAVHSKIKKIMTDRVSHASGLHIAWDTQGHRDIMVAAAQPNSGNNWNINAYAYPCINESALGLKLVCFLQHYDERVCFDSKCTDCLKRTCDIHVLDDPIWWHDGSVYQSASPVRMMKHRHSDIIVNWELNDQHSQVMNAVEKIVEDCKDSIRKKNLYQVFVRLHTLKGLNQYRPVDVHSSTWISDLWKSFKEDYPKLHLVLQTLLKADLSEDDTLAEISLSMEDYFTALEHRLKGSPTLPTKPILRLKIKPRAEQAVVTKPKLKIKPRAEQAVVTKPKLKIKPRAEQAVVTKPKIKIKPRAEQAVVTKPKIKINPAAVAKQRLGQAQTV